MPDSQLGDASSSLAVDILKDNIMSYQLAQLSFPYQDYSVSNDGRIFSMKSGELTEMNPYKNGKGYFTVKLGHGDGLYSRKYPHRLILEAFNGPAPEGKNIARHLNGNPADNRIENLAWGSVQDNSNDMIAHGNSTLGEKNSNAKLTEEIVLHIRKELEDGYTGLYLANKYHLSRSTISYIRNRKTWNHI